MRRQGTGRDRRRPRRRWTPPTGSCRSTSSSSTSTSRSRTSPARSRRTRWSAKPGDTVGRRGRSSAGSAPGAPVRRPARRDLTVGTEVLKVARDDDHAKRLQDEYDVLQGLRDRTIIEPYGLEQIAGRTVLRLEAAVGTSPTSWSKHGAAQSLDLLERFGETCSTRSSSSTTRGSPTATSSRTTSGSRSAGRTRNGTWCCSTSPSPVPIPQTSA